MRRLLIAGSLLLAIAATVATGFLLWPVWLARDVVQQVGPATRSGVADAGRQEAAAIAVRGQFAAIVRHLSILQDSAVDGGNGAFAEQERHLQRAAKEIDEAPPEVWQEPNNVLALIPYLLNGGPARPVRRRLGRKIELGKHNNAVVAMLAFAERRKDAASLMEAVEPLELPRTAGAALAMAKGIAMQSDPVKAVPHFRLARLLAPGSLIDEGSLRREILLLFAQKQQREALVRMSHYIWRFGRSAYAEQLSEHISSSVLPDIIADETLKPELASYFAAMPAARRSDLLVGLARGSVLAGRFGPIGFLSEQGKPSLGSPSHDLRMSMYVAIAAMFSSPSFDQTAMLSALDDQILSAADEGLRDATLALATKLQEPAQAASGVEQSEAGTPVLHAAQNILAQADETLMESKW